MYGCTVGLDRVCLSALAVAAVSWAVPGVAAEGEAVGNSLPFVFWAAEDVADTLGKIQFGAEPLRNEGKASGYPEMQYGCEVPREDGAAWIYGWCCQNWQETNNRTIEVIRCVTRNGREFSDEKVVLSAGGRMWQGFTNIVRRPADGMVFVLSWDGHAGLQVFQSADGTNWSEPVTAYRGHDAMCVIWYPPFGGFLNYQTALQPYPKRYPDNIGELRRVLSFKRSDDCVTWEDFSPEFLGGEPLWLPDADDPIDLEFYRAVVFPHQGRYAMILADYVPPPSEANSRRAITKHGPSYMSEWATSRDGLNWKRPFRDTNVYEDQFWLALQGPLAREGMLRFYHPDGRIASLPDDRIFYATCRANGEFSTAVFAMPEKGLALNACAKYREVEGESGQAYVMCELLDTGGQVVPGFERTRCVLENVDDRSLPLQWDGKTGGELAGTEVRLRFFLRDAKIYGLRAGE